METIIAVFDDDAGLTQAVEALREIGLNDDAISVLEGKHEDMSVPGGGLAVLPGAAPESRNAGVAVHDDRPAPEMNADNREALLDEYTNCEEQLRYYTEVLAHDGRLLALRIPDADVARVTQLLSVCDASAIDHNAD